MRIIALNAKYGVTRNMGNYESLRLDFGIDCVLDEGEVADKIYEKMRVTLRKMVEQAVTEEVEYLHGQKPNVRR